jgi:predicted nicotinamide N-methyase
LALAEALLASPTLAKGQRALELGCGLGVTAVAALSSNTQLWVADCFAEALLFTRYNALRNIGRAPWTLLLDWRSPSGRAACLKRAPFDLLLAADVLYEEEDRTPLLELVPQLLAPGGNFWLAEPGRRVSRAFVADAHECGWQDDETVYERAWPPDNATVRVTIHRLTVP